MPGMKHIMPDRPAAVGLQAHKTNAGSESKDTTHTDKVLRGTKPTHWLLTVCQLAICCLMPAIEKAETKGVSSVVF